MISKQQRLGKKEFNNVFKEGTSFHSDFLFVKILKTENSNQSKFSVSIPIKIVKKAVERNLLRRRLYSIINKNLDKTKEGFNVVIILKKGGEKIDFDTYKKEIELLFKKTKLVKNPRSTFL